MLREVENRKPLLDNAGQKVTRSRSIRISVSEEELVEFRRVAKSQKKSIVAFIWDWACYGVEVVRYREAQAAVEQQNKEQVN